MPISIGGKQLSKSGNEPTAKKDSLIGSPQPIGSTILLLVATLYRIPFHRRKHNAYWLSRPDLLAFLLVGQVTFDVHGMCSAWPISQCSGICHRGTTWPSFRCWNGAAHARS